MPTFPQITSPPQVSAERLVNEMGVAIEHVATYARAWQTSSGLTHGYYGGPWGDVIIPAGTLALTGSATNYLVVNRSTGVQSTSTSDTNWNDTATYARVYKYPTNSTAIITASAEDHRTRTYGVFAPSGLGATAASLVSVADAGGYFAGTNVEAVLQELGAAGAGAVSIPAQRWTIDRDSTADSDPGAGLLKFNHATPSSATFLYIDDATLDAIDLSTYFTGLGATGWVKMVSKLDAAEWMIFKWSAVTDGTGYFKFAVVHQASRGTLDDADEVLVTFDSDANTGSGGTELKGLTFTSDTGSTADSDPGAGLMKWNNATQGSATKLFFDNTTLDSVTITAFFAALGTDATLFMQQGDDATRWQLWEIDTATADSGYYDFAVTLLAKSSSDIQDDKTVLCDFSRKGTSGGSTQGKHAIFIGIDSMRSTITNGGTAVAQTAGATDQPDPWYGAFDQTTDQKYLFRFAMPESWDEGTLSYRGVWQHAATTTNFGVALQLRAVAFSDDDAYAANFGTAVVVTDTGGTTGDVYRTDESGALTVAGTPQAGDLVVFEFSRDPDHASDTLNEKVRPLGVVLYITTNADTDA